MPIRHDLPLRHAPRQADETGRCTKHDEETLLRMRFQAIEPTVIERPIPSATSRPQAGTRPGAPPDTAPGDTPYDPFPHFKKPV